MGFWDKVKERASQVYDQVNMLDNNRTYQQRTPTNKASIGDQLRSDGTAIGLGALRSATGTVQGVSGLYDAVTPGQGQNRLTKGANNFAEEIDRTARNEHVSSGLYKGAQGFTDALTFVIPGGAYVRGAAYASKAPKVIKAAETISKIPTVSKVSAALAHGSQFVDDAARYGNKGQRVIAKTTRFVKKPTTVSNVSVGTGLAVGNQSARNQDISPTTVAEDVGINLAAAGALHGVGIAAEKGVGKVKSVIENRRAARAPEPVVETAAPAPIPQNTDNLERNVLNTKAKNEVLTVPEKARREELNRAAETPADTPEPTATFDDISNTFNQSADEAKALYHRGRLQKLKDAVMRTYDPWAEAEKIDRAYAKSVGVKYEKLPAEHRLTHLLNQTANSKTIANEKLRIPTSTGQSVAQVVQRYGADTPAGKDFMNYLHLRRDMRLREQSKGTKKLFPGIDDKTLQNSVAEYEARNPNAVQDRLTIVAQMNDDLDRGVGILYSKKDADFVKAYYGDDYVPIDRIFSENLVRPEISGRSLGSIGKQRILSQLEPGSDLQINNTFDAILGRSELVEKQMAQAKVARTMVDRHKAGVTEGTRLLVDSEKQAQRKELRQQLKDLVANAKKLTSQKSRVRASERVAIVIERNKQFNAMKAARNELKAALKKEADAAKQTANKLDKKIIGAKGNVKVSAKVAAQAQKKAVTAAKNALRATIDKNDTDALAALDSMTNKDLLEALTTQVQNGEKGFAAARGASRAGKKLAVSEDKVVQLKEARDAIGSLTVDKDVQQAINNMDDDELLNVFRAITEDGDDYYKNLRKSLDKSTDIRKKLGAEVGRLREELKDNATARAQNQETYATLAPDPTTGKQVISGIDGGETFKLEVTPEQARMLQGLDERELNTIVKVAVSGQRVFQTAWTGFLNVLFPVQSFIFYDVLPSIINSKRGVRTVLTGHGTAEMFRSIRSNDNFQRMLRLHGANITMASGIPIDSKLTAEAMAAQASWAKRVKFNVKHPKEMVEALDVIGGKLSNASRSRNARAYYDAAIKEGRSHESAMQDAVYAYNNILPNYPRASFLAKQLNAAAPYVTASIAGTRALLQGIRNNPARAAAIIAGGVVAPSVATTAYNLQSKEGQEFYEDMRNSGKEYLLDNNLVVVLPGAHKDPKTGEWKGILKMPVAPEVRALNRMTWRGTHDMVSDTTANELDPTLVATTLFDFVTGGLRGNSNPMVDTARIVQNQDPRSDPFNPQPLVDGEMAERPKSEQAYDTTSTAGRFISKATGGKVSPIQGDAMLNQLGVVGQVAENRGGNPAATVKDAAVSRVSGAYGEKNSTIYYDTNKKYRDELKNYQDRKAYDQMMATDKEKGIMDAAEKAVIYKNRPEVFNAFAKSAKEVSRRTGEAYDPVFDLSGDDLQAYLNIQIANNTSPGSPESRKLKKDNKDWYPAFQEKRSAFFDNLPKKESDNSETAVPTSKEILYPELSEETSKKVDAYAGMTDPAAKRQYMIDNPDIGDYYNKYNQYIRDRRDQLHLPQYDKYPTPSPEVQAMMDTYNSLPEHDGKKGGNKTRALFLKDHPEVTDQWSKSAQYNLENDAAMALYEDEDLTEKGIKAITSLAKSLGVSTGSGGSGGFGSGGGGGSGGGSIKSASYGSFKEAPSGSVKSSGAKKIAVKRRSQGGTPGKIKVTHTKTT